MKRQTKIDFIHALREKKERHRKSLAYRTYLSFYGWQKAFNAATALYKWCLLMAANQVGKSRTGCCIDAYHLTGEYPEDWEGFKFEHSITAWLLGYSGEKTRDLLQKKLFGEYDPLKREFEGGLIPKDKILDQIPMSGTPRAMREVKVKHVKGVSICQFWSYSQGQHALMGDVVDWVHIDEEPEDHEIFPQVLTRTLNGNRGAGGRGILTFTPENGMTELVTSFRDEDKEGQYIQTATWDDCPHMTEDKKREVLDIFPSYQRDMRSKGVPLMGAGLIYEVDEDKIKVEPFKIPEYWFVIDGMDFGWDHPQAHIQMVWDRDADIFYIVNAWKESKQQPFEAWHVVKPWADGVPTAWPADGLQTEKGSAKQQMSYYEEEGFWMLDEHATWESGGNGVEAGLMELNSLMKTGRFKVFSNLGEVFTEIREYHRKSMPSGKSVIVKKKDDYLDGIRYAYMMRRYAIRICDINDNYQVNQPIRHEGRDEISGY